MFGMSASSLLDKPPATTTASTSLFGSTTTTAQPATSLFGTTNTTTQPTTSLFGQPQQQPATTSLFGAPKPTSSLFQTPAAQNQATTSLFGQPANPQPTTSLFGSTNNAQAPAAGSLFGATNNTQQQQTQQQPIGSLFGQSIGNRVWNEQDMAPRQKAVQDQIQILARKWEPNDPNCAFKAYLYNSVPKEQRPFYGPGPFDDEEKWEEALRKAPNTSTIPVLVTGFHQLGQRMVLQSNSLRTLQGRLHEINNGLTELLRRHDLEISARAAECKRRHIRLSQKCLALATKTQVLRNRGYAMDAAEEQLRQRLLDLEKKALDPALNGRSEEIWARMVTVRDRGTALNAELERLGQAAKTAGVNADTSSVMDEAMIKKVKQILEEYDSQIQHLDKELGQVQGEFKEWQDARS